WVVKGIREPVPFFQHVSLLMPPGSTLYVEGITIHSQAATFYAKHESAHPIPVACNTVFPIPDCYHLDFSAEVVAGMLELAAQHSIHKLFHHVEGYRSEQVTFTFHDAFEGYFKIADTVPEAVVSEFCGNLG